MNNYSIALIGNPNVGKSSLFNVLTGQNQHTGNWPGKTVAVAKGAYRYKGKDYEIIDLPGTYSLRTQSEEEAIAAEYFASKAADCTVIVADATCLERNLVFALQVLEQADNCIICLSLLDEASRFGLEIDLKRLRFEIGVPLVGISARTGEGIEELKETIRSVSDGFSVHRGQKQRHTSVNYAAEAKRIVRLCITGEKVPKLPSADRIILSPVWGRFVLLMMLFGVFWLTIVGANYPSALLKNCFVFLGKYLTLGLSKAPVWLRGLLMDGIYATTADVISVMLPPMLIFYPLFSILENIGFLPRSAFLMDHTYEKCGSCGKQFLTMTMGFGCNAVGVMGCRIIGSSKERLIAMVTNALVPCNGKFPTLIILTGFLCHGKPVLAALLLTSVIILGCIVSLITTKVLSLTVAEHDTQKFILELPPYRCVSFKNILSGSILEKIVFVFSRAIFAAIPAGAVIWLLQNIFIQGNSLINILAQWLDPLGKALGMSGAILLAFFLSLPANELFLPLVVTIMGCVSAEQALSGIGWSGVLCMVVFSLFHWPCTTTSFTIYHQTRSWRWTIAAILIPTVIGTLFCLLIS